MAFIKRSKVEFVNVIEDENIPLNDKDTRQVLEKAAKEDLDEKDTIKETN